MSLNKVQFANVVKKQYLFKLRAYTQVLLSLIMLQAVAILFSFNGVGSSGINSGLIDVSTYFYSANFVVAFSMLWGFVTAILITTKSYRYDDFAFIANRFTSNLANLLVLLTASVIGSITSLLSTYLLKVLMRLFKGSFIQSANPPSSIGVFLIGILAVILYIFLFSALGYLIGTLVQISKLFTVLLPALLFGSQFFAEAEGSTGMIQSVYEIFFKESSFLLFIGKVMVTAAVLFISAFLLSNRMEVRTK
jgi:hypothetical protein